MKTMPTRIDGELFEAARAVGEVQSRSAAQQLDHWARIGRELESSPAMTLDTIVRVLSGEESYDSLNDNTQAAVRVAWNEQIAHRIAGLDLTRELEKAERPWAESDAEGRMVIVQNGASTA